ncbi:acyl carrier protein [Streptomyces sp. NBC_00102]|uniref:acyl carrier protein n=1 Tax=Streptomyces sp. NBC_00102 TaxID=2975652 RepID=UPI00225AC47F|nr:phosphopantetheine-binding protein [Streptomyces sp. NBC_00102]MCX5396906.1 phosphopantetheine-binding protein [Streptomyces sp. NBC_00102]
MEDGTMYETLTRLLVEEFGLDEEQVRPDATARQLELDSLSLAELAVIITEATGVRLEDVEVNPDSTLGQMAEAFDRALPPGAASAPSSAPDRPAAPASAPGQERPTAPATAPATSFGQALPVAPAQS